MSYDISLIDKVIHKPCSMSKQKIRGGTVPAEIDPATGLLVQSSQTECHINITYNYSPYYEIFIDDVDYGIQGLYGMTAKESIPVLEKMIEDISKRYQDENHNWKTKTGTRTHYYYKDGTECNDIITAYLKERAELNKVEEKYQISEGDTSNYWEATAANALIPLTDMLNMALYNINNKDAVWEGD